jgi:hypothetical protein
MRAAKGARLATIAAVLIGWTACAEEAPKPPPASSEATSGGPTPAAQACAA